MYIKTYILNMCTLLYIRYILIKLIQIFKKGKTLTLLYVYVQSVASIGNTLNSVHLAVEAIQKTVDEHKKAMEVLQSDLVRKCTSIWKVSTLLPPLF